MNKGEIKKLAYIISHVYFVCLKEKLPLHNSRKAVYNDFLYISRLFELHLTQTFSIPAKCRAQCIAFGTCGRGIGEKKVFYSISNLNISNMNIKIQFSQIYLKIDRLNLSSFIKHRLLCPPTPQSFRLFFIFNPLLFLLPLACTLKTFHTRNSLLSRHLS